MYLMVEFAYGNYGLWEKLTDDEWAEICSVVPTFPKERTNWPDNGPHLLTDESLPVLAKHNIEFRLSRDEANHGVGTMLVKLQDRIKALELDRTNMAELIQNQAAVQIHVPDIVLMKIDEVQVLTDCCTEALQAELDDDWRILAVCPPNAQRRPDYVLGRRSSHLPNGKQ